VLDESAGEGAEPEVSGRLWPSQCEKRGKEKREKDVLPVGGET
jgi:hypothetical protein